MPSDDPDLLAIDRGTVTAPAGCGKTQLIAKALTRHAGTKPVLVLTHTNAGVAALRLRLVHARIPSKAYRLSTIDGWSMKLISTFPTRSGHDSDILKLANPATDYPSIREGAVSLLKAGHISDILSASYSRVIVDEYQDCSSAQHLIVAHTAEVLPTCVLGDPMQAIFGFGGVELAKWDEQVCLRFPVVKELTTPWRWINADAEELGLWLLEVRRKLLCGEPIDLHNSPGKVSWVELDGTEDHQRQLEAARVRPSDREGRVLIIGDSRNPVSQRLIASQTFGATTVEAVDLRDFVSFARVFNLAAPDALAQLSQFAQGVMTNVGAENLVRRVQSLIHGRARNPPNNVERLALSFVRDPSHRAAADLLIEIKKQDGTRTHRPTVLRTCTKALYLCAGTEGLSFHDAAIRMREQNRMIGRPLPRRAVGSTLLLKGLESEVAVVLNAGELDARNLYVAMTRGSKALVVCSRTPMLSPNH